jgi:hypothetical protein
MGKFKEKFGGSGNRIPHIHFKCGVCGRDMHLGPAAYRARMKKSKSGVLYHKACYNGKNKKHPELKAPYRSTCFKVKAGTRNPYHVSGSDIRGYRITVPTSATKISMFYTLKVEAGGVLVYTPEMEVKM